MEMKKKGSKSPIKENQFETYFHIKTEDNLAQSSMNIFPLDYHNKVLGEKDYQKTVLEKKVELSGKNIKKLVKKNSLTFPEKEIDKGELIECIGALPKDGEEQSLVVRNFPEISNEKFEELQKKICDVDTLRRLYTHLQNLKCDLKEKFCEDSVGGISPLSFLIELNYVFKFDKIKEMSEKYNILKKYIYNYRTINGDGNCFYRAVIFRYLEVLILSKNIKLLQNLTNDIIQSYDSEELKSRRVIQNNDIKPDLTFKILLLIIYLLKKDMTLDAYKTMLISFITCKKFDYAIILYFRYILYKYIRDNENKIYKKNFPIKIGNLLPSQFEKEDGNFLYEKFYENYLLKFFTDAEKVIIYLTPYVLGIDLNIIIYDITNEEIIQNFTFEGESKIKFDDSISLLNSKNHYEIVYSKEDNQKYKNFFEICENNFQSVVLFAEPNIIKKNSSTSDDDFRLLRSQISGEKIDSNEINLSHKTVVQTKKFVNIDNNSSEGNNSSKQITNNKKNNKELPKPKTEIIKKPINKEKELKHEENNLLGQNSGKNIVIVKKVNVNKNKEKIETVKRCDKCTNVINIKNEEILICDKCFKKNIFATYLLCKNKNIDPIEYIFGNNKNNIAKYIPIYNEVLKNKIEKDRINSHMQNKECILKEEHVKKIIKKLPCGCLLCIHIYNYLYDKYETKYPFLCVCDKKYSINDMIQLGIFFQKNFKGGIIEGKIIEYFDNKLKEKCCICSETLKDKENNNIKVEVIEQSQGKNVNLSEKNNFIKCLKHFSCEKCIKKSDNFMCRICKLKHKKI